MAQIIDKLKVKRGRPQILPWEEWTDGQARRLVRGQDFTAGLLSMRTMIHRKAQQLNMHALTRIDEVNQTIEVQFYHDDSEQSRR